MKEISIFLGANTGRGFRSLYDEYIGQLDLKRLIVIKGSAGCGKSGLMKRIAKEGADRGERVLRILCSGDPDSLDGVFLPDRGAALFDGTSPHVLEPSLVGERGFYADLSRFFTAPASGLAPLEEAYREHYRKAYRYLAAAQEAEEVQRFPAEAAAAIRQRAKSLAVRTLPLGRESGRVRRYFTDAFTCRGSISLTESRRALCPKLITLSGGSDRADLFAQVFLQEARERGWDAVICPDARNPERIAHLMIPAAGVGLTTGEGDRRIRLEKLGPKPDEAERSEDRELKQLRDSLLASAQRELSAAKADHDRLEAAIHPRIDFRGVDRETERLMRQVFEE